MTDFRPDCIINLHVEFRGNPAKVAWACSVSEEKRGNVVLARKFLGMGSREEAELEALLFGLKQASRLLQEKVEVTSTFSLEGKLTPGKSARKGEPALVAKRDEVARIWKNFRLKKVSKMDGPQAVILREEVDKAYLRKRDLSDSH